MLRWIIPLGTGLVIAAGSGAYAVMGQNADQGFATDIGCSIMFADGNPYWDEFSKTQLVEANKEVRKLRGQGGWLIVLRVDSERERLIADYDSAERKARREKAKAYYRNLVPVSDPTQAVTDCILNVGEP